ncbi:hypothetical protein N0V82_001780 [Gnomoniopsis sp. IMI 355080]|nr:hypothetical protein N0V82_001780 [Gnomoniopsis sp. IMI 355080]
MRIPFTLLRPLVVTACLGQSHVVAAAPSLGCANATGASDVKTDSMSNVKLGSRDYLLYIPTQYEPAVPAPLILSYHGGSRDAGHQAALDQFNSTFFNEDYLVAYPNSVDGFWQGSPGVTSDDIGFTKKILDQVGGQYCVDDERIYATGKSQGGGMAGLLAADPELSTMIAAFAPVAGAFYVSEDAKCRPDTVNISSDPGRPDIPILEFHGGADDVIPYDGGADRGDCLPAIPHWVQSWAQSNGLDPDTNTTSKVKGATNNQATVFQFGTGDSLGMVTHIMVGKDIGHDWPSTEDNEDNTIQGHGPASFNASSLIIEFFRNHSMPMSRTLGPETSGDQTATGLGPSAAPTATTQIGSNSISASTQQRFSSKLLICIPSVALLLISGHISLGI